MRSCILGIDVFFILVFQDFLLGSAIAPNYWNTLLYYLLFLDASRFFKIFSLGSNIIVLFPLWIVVIAKIYSSGSLLFHVHALVNACSAV